MNRQMRQGKGRGRRAVSAGTAAIALGGTLVATTGFATAAPSVPAGTGTTTGIGGASGPGSSEPSSPSPFTVHADGWIDFTSTKAGTPPLTNAHTVTVAGHLGTNGNCSVPQPTMANPFGVDTYSSEIAFNPVRCKARYREGDVSPSTAAGLGIKPARQPLPAAATPPATATPLGVASAHTVPNFCGSACTWSAYQKDAYLDPLDITITSLASNLTWTMATSNEEVLSYQGTLVPYRFAYDGWSGGPPAQQDYKNSADTTVNQFASYQSSNTDFEQYMLAAFGPTVVAVCGGAAPAVFTQDMILSTG